MRKVQVEGLEHAFDVAILKPHCKPRRRAFWFRVQHLGSRVWEPTNLRVKNRNPTAEKTVQPLHACAFGNRRQVDLLFVGRRLSHAASLEARWHGSTALKAFPKSCPIHKQIFDRRFTPKFQINTYIV